jgi:PilZ domain
LGGGFPFFGSPCRTLRFVGRWCGRASNLSCARSHERGALSRAEGDCATLYSPNPLTEKEATAMAKFRYCERVHTHFPVVFAGEAYVGEGTVLNVSVPGCAVHSRKPVQPGSYLEMRMLVPDTTSPLRVGLAKVRWCEGRRFGVEFIQMPGEDQVYLGRLVKNEVPLALPPRSSA